MKEGFNIIEEITLPADFQSLVDVENLVEKVCQTVGVQEDAFGNVLIAVTEAVNNAIQHGNKMNKNLNVDLFVGDKETDFCFSVKDAGQGFDFENLADPTAPENIEKEDGRGIFLMKSLAEEVAFFDNGSNVQIYFTKK
mgnify:CR=1 FL=1